VIRGSDVANSFADRILQSAAFRNAPSSRRLLKYLADHSVNPGADPLKEYTIGVDAFGKPADYDPRLDSTVRIQIGRLRQKLAEYYEDEGKDDPFILDLPKGHFRLICEPRVSEPTASEPESQAPVESPLPPVPATNWRTIALSLAAVCVCLVSALVYTVVKSRPKPQVSSWTPELAELWHPFADSGRPLLIAVGNPLFLQFENKAVYRDLSIEKSEDLVKSGPFQALGKALGNQATRPVHYYAAVGDVTAAFDLGQRLGPRQPSMSIVRSSQLQWQQLADSNVLFLGPPRFFGDKLSGLPVALEVIEIADGFRIVHPQSGEPSFYKFRDPTGFFVEDGEAVVLITHAPGPVGNTDVMTFASNSTFGRVGAVAAFTDAAFAKTLIQKIRVPNGRIPSYFQVLLRVKYKGGVPTETSYLLHRELRRRN
jgi:hypothetical protein